MVRAGRFSSRRRQNSSSSLFDAMENSGNRHRRYTKQSPLQSNGVGQNRRSSWWFLRNTDRPGVRNARVYNYFIDVSNKNAPRLVGLMTPSEHSPAQKRTHIDIIYECVNVYNIHIYICVHVRVHFVDKYIRGVTRLPRFARPCRVRRGNLICEILLGARVPWSPIDASRRARGHMSTFWHQFVFKMCTYGVPRAAEINCRVLTQLLASNTCSCSERRT